MREGEGEREREREKTRFGYITLSIDTVYFSPVSFWLKILSNIREKNRFGYTL